MVETSPKHWHVYWRVSDVKLGEFEGKQRALNELHGGDPCIVDLRA